MFAACAQCLLHARYTLAASFLQALASIYRAHTFIRVAQSFSHAKAQQRSDNLPQHEMHEVYQSMTGGRLYRFFNGVVITKSSIDMYCT